MKIMSDHNHIGMIMGILRDEYERNKDNKNIEINTYIEATNYVEDEINEFLNIERTDKEVSDFINSVLKILYRKDCK